MAVCEYAITETALTFSLVGFIPFLLSFCTNENLLFIAGCIRVPSAEVASQRQTGVTFRVHDLHVLIEMVSGSQ